MIDKTNTREVYTNWKGRQQQQENRGTRDNDFGCIKRILCHTRYCSQIDQGYWPSSIGARLIAYCKYFDWQNYRFYKCPISRCSLTVILAAKNCKELHNLYFLQHIIMSKEQSKDTFGKTTQVKHVPRL